MPAARHQGRGAPCGESFWHWALGADGGHGHAQPPFRSSRLIGAERQPTSDCRQSLQQSQWTYLYRAVDKRGDTIDFYLSPTRSAKAAKRFLGKALRGLKHWEKPATLNTDKAPSYGAAITELKREGKLDRETAHRQVKYLNNVIEADHGKLKILIKPVRGFKSIPTAYATIKGFEVMRALRKGQARPWCLQPGIRGEVRLVERAFGIGPSALTEAMGMLNHHFAAAA
uniref:Transposase n=2 Tax=Pseudomonadota TaxID=1224 RepID=A0A144J348_9SPHN|nr:transposase [Sphingobium baderi]